MNYRQLLEVSKKQSNPCAFRKTKLTYSNSKKIPVVDDGEKSVIVASQEVLESNFEEAEIPKIKNTVDKMITKIHKG